MRKLVVAIAAAVGLVAGGTALSPAAASPGPAPAAAPAAPAFRPAPIAWGACADESLSEVGAQCGFLTVPLDYRHPRGEKIQLAVSRLRHTTSDAAYQGVMLVNPGGPGGSGLIYSVLRDVIPNGAGQSYDWIGFDPRGVGSSRPALACDGSYFGYDRPLYEPVTRSLERTWLRRSQGYAEDCTKAGGDLLDHLRTTDNARDMDSLRQALGSRQINFYGFSYGTYLGQVYNTMFPGRVRRMVFDGVIDPQRIWYRSNLDQDVAFDRSVKVFFAWVAKYDAVYHLGTTARQVERRYFTERARLIRRPAGGLIGPDEWTDIFTSAAYYVYGWESVAGAFSAWANGRDPEPLLELYPAPGEPDDGSDNLFAIYLATECTDAPWPSRWSTWRADNWRTFAKAPFFTWANAWFNAPCLYWSGDAGRRVTVTGAKAPPILMINETYDGATPYAGALAARRLFPRSVLIEGVGGSTHAGSLSGVACTDGAIARYLADGTLPARVPGNRSDVQCPPVPAPDPTAAPATLAAAAGMPTELRAGIGGPRTH